MSELKTIKDIYESIKGFDNIEDSKKQERYLTLKMIEKVAIEWVKFFEKERKEQEDYRVKQLESAIKGNYESERESHVEIFKDFFNITEEDLK